ncbi:PREDICTED: manganese-dependent ADP-ribose/CDP-alcohol diphosphatase [Nanorana parkeri]|uniref:manganese-dependent ADP-ribose/CDP-alcohol diphosphatase n=1 Tax=Nanorana parkeri TaxID=125878 RepID=UPI000854A60E|nr:PREDICTED: manganese-dependent ADP-ribose/CDP-alcohol diphosphatase [Nanorana parkeri]
MDETQEPLFTFGVIADIQYADKDDGYNYVKTRMRYYRSSLSLLQDAAQEWASETARPAFILQLGDIIDGFNVPLGASETSLAKVLDEFDKLKVPVHHIWGNHEFYNFSRKQLVESKLNSAHLGETQVISPENGHVPESFYAYHFSPFPKFRILLMDSYDFSVIGRDPTSHKYVKSLKVLKQKNKNADLNSPTGLDDPQFVQFNGGISHAQLNWINDVLQSSDNNGEKVMVAGHLPIYLPSTDPICLTWNYLEVLSTLQSHPSVVAYFAGHDHDGGYCQDEHGIHHITFNGVIETPPDSQAFATMEIYEDRMELRGRGLVPHRTLIYRNS